MVGSHFLLLMGFINFRSYIETRYKNLAWISLVILWNDITFGKKTYCNKKCRITPWQEKNINPHSDLKQ